MVPEVIAARNKYDKSCFTISYKTIYRTIYNGLFDESNLNRGKTRHIKGYEERRGKIKIAQTIYECPIAANERPTSGYWESDTVVGQTGKVWLFDFDRSSIAIPSIRKSRKGCQSHKVSEKVVYHMITMFRHLPSAKCRTLAPDRGK